VTNYEARRALPASVHAQLNHTGELNAIYLLDQQVGQLVAEGIRDAASAKIPALLAQRNNGIHHSPYQLPYRSLALRRPRLPVKYLLVTMFVPSATSSSALPRLSCRKIVTPSRPINAVALLPFDGVEGDFFPSVKNRWKTKPSCAGRCILCSRFHGRDFPLNACSL